jgi:hypothetical protein
MIAYNDCDCTDDSVRTNAQLMVVWEEDKDKMAVFEDLLYVREERDYYNSLFRAMFKTKLALYFLSCTYFMLYYRKLLFSISGWLNNRGKNKKS